MDDCPNCKGDGIVKKRDACGMLNVLMCPVCMGTGKKGKTREDYFRKCPLENMAMEITNYIFSVCTTGEYSNLLYAVAFDSVMEWLKEKHDESNT